MDINTDALRKRALEFENDIETCLVDNNGLLMSGIDISTMKPFPRGYFEGKNFHDYPGRSWSDYCEFIQYENVGMCSGAYLAAMTWKYAVTKEPSALEKACRTFRGIKYLFDASQFIEEGYYCKCHGGKMSDMISSDQYIYTMWGLNEFMRFADAGERAQCVEMIDKMTSFWIRRDYSHPYYGRSLNWPIERFPGFSWLAYHHTGKKKFLDEYERLCRLPEVIEKIPFCGYSSLEDLLKQTGEREAWSPFEEKTGLRLFCLDAETSESGFLSIAPMLEYNAPGRELWLNKVWQLYDINKCSITEDGLATHQLTYDKTTGKIAEVQELIHEPPSGPSRDFKLGGFCGCVRSGMWSPMFARSCVALQPYFPDQPILGVAAHILKNVTRDKLHWFKDVAGQFPPDIKWADNVYSGDGATHWLWTYWEACAKYGMNWDQKL